MTCKRSYPTLLCGAAALLGLSLAPPRVAHAQNTVPQLYATTYKLEAQRKYRDALKAIKRVPGEQQKSYFYQLRLGWLAYLVGSLNLSVEAYRRAAALEPRAIEPLLGLILPQIAARRWKDAETTARKVLRMAPGDYTASSKLAWVLYNLGRFAEAERVYRRILGRYPADLEMHTGLGWSLLKQGKKDEARKVFNWVLSVSPNNYSAQSGIKALEG